MSAQRTTEGFSTITMQLVGNLYLDRTDISFNRKFNEMALAWQLERKYSKDEILDLYLNTVYFGSNAYGVEAAAKTYFDKDPVELTLPEAALIAGLPQAPSGFSPRKHPERALARRNLVINKHVLNGFITEDEAEAALLTPIELAPYSPYTQVQEPYVVAYVRKQLIDMFGEDKVFQGGLQVETTINPAYQKLATDAITSTLNKQGDPSAALVSIETDHRLHQGHGGRHRLRHLQVQPGLPGPAPGRLGVQDLRAHRRRRDGHRSRGTPTTCPCRSSSRSRDPRSRGRSRPTAARATASPRWCRPPSAATTRSTRSWPSTSAPTASSTSPTAWASPPTSTPTRPSSSAVSSTASPRWRWPPPTGPWPTQGEHVEPTIILQIKDSSGKVIWKANPKRTQAISAGVAYDVTRILEQNIQHGHGHQGQDRPAGRRQDRHRPGEQRRLVLRLHPAPLHHRVGGPSRGADPHERRARHQRSPAAASRPSSGRSSCPWPTSDYPEAEFAAPSVLVKYNPCWVSQYAAWPSSTTTKSTTTTLPPAAHRRDHHAPTTTTKRTTTTDHDRTTRRRAARLGTRFCVTPLALLRSACLTHMSRIV